MKKIIEVHGVVERPVKVIQFGEGNFLRAFVDKLIHRLNEETSYEGSVVVVQPIDHGMTKMLDDQNCLYTHIEKGMENNEAKLDYKLIDVISQTIRPYEDFNSFLELAHLPEVNVIVSNTTEAGIVFMDTDLFEDAPQKSFPGKLTRLLFERFKVVNGDVTKGYSIVPCELIDNNGVALKETVFQYANLWKLGEEFLTWLEEANDFISTLVDRIVPGFPRDTINEVWDMIGYEDQLVVESERFLLWVLDDVERFKSRLPLGELKAGVVYTKDIKPYKMRKVRVLNGLHTFMVPIGMLGGIDTVRESVEHPVFGKLIKQVMIEEVVESLDMDKEEILTYGNEVINRFLNPYVKHELASISLNSISKFKTRVLPSILNYVKKKNELPKGLVFSMASLFTLYRGTYLDRSFDIRDSEEIKAYFAKQWKNADDTKEFYQLFAKEVLSNEEFWATDLTQINNFVDLLVENLIQIQQGNYLQLMEGVVNE